MNVYKNACGEELRKQPLNDLTESYRASEDHKLERDLERRSKYTLFQDDQEILLARRGFELKGHQFGL